MRRINGVLLSVIAVAAHGCRLLPLPGCRPVSRGNRMRSCSEQLQRVHGLSDGQMQSIRRIFSDSGYIGQGNPAIARHPVSPQGCQEKLASRASTTRMANLRRSAGPSTWRPSTIRPGKKPRMPGPASISSSFPTSPAPTRWSGCAPAKPPRSAGPWASVSVTPTNGKGLAPAPSNHPITASTWPRASPPTRPSNGCGRPTTEHTAPIRPGPMVPPIEKGICAASSHKTPGCGGGSWTGCGSNTYPAGTFPDCHSPLGVYDQHGNAAEHMNLPLNESQMSSRGSKELGVYGDEGKLVHFRYLLCP